MEKTASSPAATLKHGRQNRAPSPIESSNEGNASLSPRSRPLKDLVDVIGRLVDVLDSTVKSTADQGDTVNALIYDPDLVSRAQQPFHSSSDHDANQIGSTSSNEAHIPQQVLGEFGEPGSVNSANGAAAEEVKTNAQVVGSTSSQLVSTTVNLTGEKENESIAGIDQRREATHNGFLKAAETQAALQGSVEKEPNTGLGEGHEAGSQGSSKAINN